MYVGVIISLKLISFHFSLKCIVVNNCIAIAGVEEGKGRGACILFQTFLPLRLALSEMLHCLCENVLICISKLLAFGVSLEHNFAFLFGAGLKCKSAVLHFPVVLAFKVMLHCNCGT